MLKMNRKGGARHSLCYSIGKERGRVDGVQGGHGARVVRKVQSGAKADFKDRSSGGRKQALPFGLESCSTEYPIHEAGENIGGVHGVGPVPAIR